jgi:hypothetical protein
MNDPIHVSQGADWEFAVLLEEKDPESGEIRPMNLTGYTAISHLRKAAGGEVLMDLEPTLVPEEGLIVFEKIVPHGSPIAGLHFFDCFVRRPGGGNPERALETQPVNIRFVFADLTNP